MNLYLLFNHTLTRDQENDARQGLGVRQIIEPPTEIKNLWSNVPPELEGIHPVLEPVRKWLAASAQPGDYVLIQGDFGACWLMVLHARDQGLLPIYATTRREAHEEHQADGGVRLVHHFRHVRYRAYGS